MRKTNPQKALTEYRGGGNLHKKAGYEKKYIFFEKIKCYLFHKSNSFVKFVPMK